jgi:sulfur carrier protein
VFNVVACHNRTVLGKRDFKKVQVFQQSQFTIPASFLRAPLAFRRAYLHYRRQLESMMEISVNGEMKAFESPLSVADLLARLGLPQQKIAVEHNLEIVPKSAYDTHMLDAGDRIEIVHFIGGG